MNPRPAIYPPANSQDLSLGLILAFAVYFFAQFVTRLLLSDSLQVDEAEQILLAQNWSWGYGSQPPLYTWLQKIVFNVLGEGVAALSLLKNVLLFGCYLTGYALGRRVFSDARLAAAVPLIFLLLPNLVWESQRDQTHLILTTLCALGLIYAFLEVWQTAAVGWYLAAGCLAGFGILAKYNFAFVLLGLLGAALTMPPSRHAVCNLKILISLAALVAITACHLFWAMEHPEIVTAQRYKFEIAQQGYSLKVMASQLGRFAVSILAFVAVPIGVCFLLFRPRTSPPFSKDSALLLIWRTILISLLLTLAVVLIFRVREIRPRWFQPVLILLPFVLIHWFSHVFTQGKLRILKWAAVATALAGLAAINGTALAARYLGRSHNLNAPFPAWREQLKDAGFERAFIVAENKWIAGNLRLQFPLSSAVSPDLAYLVTRHPGPTFLVWDAGDEDMIPGKFRVQIADKICGCAAHKLPANFVSAPGRHGDKKRYRLGYARTAN